MRFLVIDNDSHQRWLISRELRREFSQAEVNEIIDTDSLEQALTVGNFDLAVTDYQLHWSNGLEIVRLLKERYPDRPVIMFTDTGNQEIAVEAMKSGLDDYILKSPKHYPHLRASVRSAVERASERRQTATLEGQLRSLLEQHSLGVFQVIPSDRFLETNDALLQILAVRSMEEAQTSEFYRFLSHQGNLGQGQHRKQELLLHRENGETFWGLLSETLTTIEGTTVIAGLLEDITPRKQLEESLRRYASRLETLRQLDRSILQNLSPAEIAHLALQATAPLIQCQLLDITLFNSELQEVTVLAAQTSEGIRLNSGQRFSFEEYGAIDQLQRNEAVIINDLSELDNPSPLMQQFAAQGIRSIARLPIRVQDELIGSLKLASIQPHAFTQEDTDIAQELVSQMAIAIQQSQLRQELQQYAEHLEQEVQRRTQELETTNSDLESFVYLVSHDLREPLRAIQAYNQILLEDHLHQLDQEGKLCTQRIAENAVRMSKLIQDLLEYSRLGRIELPLQPVNLSQLIHEILNQLKLELDQRQVQVRLEDPLPMLKGHYPTLLQIITNLLTNAIKFVRPTLQPQVRIWAEPSGQFLRLWVEDNGIGIDPQYHDRIFQVFERLHSLEIYPGTGVGLAIVQKGIERMGGRVGVESGLDQGSRFWIELPKIEST
ncbi:response regulator (plasmid) [Kovacikia minuta CCNUW1]|uniref:ATP-binding protein n=1 Tax=Kovacikia minuta TaxID=2931930 RepID=UPI001CCFB64D|nr:ATP-binding protein [Kovacikia minuta]UBF30221.1 response regulator [Kovacikia minuta CCNUW1]